MLTHADNQLLTRVGPGTSMGEVMRRYWIPALMSEELPEPDCPPVRVRLLGEQLVAFRDTAGRIGLLDEFCPHRRASLFLGRNEEAGLRCVYHGWKFDVQGRCLDMMNEPAESDYKDKVRQAAYPTLEQGGVIWAYLGPAGKEPAPPSFEWTQAPESHRRVSKVWQECNWLQALEGGIDTAHAPILHRTITRNTTRPGIGIETDLVQGAAPTVEVDLTDYGYRYAGVRSLGERGSVVRTYHYVMPFHQIRPRQSGYRGQPGRPTIAGHMWVPMNDENCMIYNWVYSYGDEPITDAQWVEIERGYGRGPGQLLPDFRSVVNRGNDWRIDRQVQKTETFTGIEGINAQDVGVQESMGTIVDRSRENLSRSDMAIVTARRLLLQAAQTVADGGDPPGVGTGYYRARAIERVLPKGVQWRDALLEEMYPA
jgi:phenylpropionate dioxygenase-like ring-hydroxylating dioxygenase large terminal subunit